MKPALIAIALLAAATPAMAADASPAGTWRVSGSVSGFKFELRCVFQQAGERLTGTCTDLATNNPKAPPKSAPHALTRGSAAGGRIGWTYQSSFLVQKFDVTYSGALTGDTMSGTIQANGASGRFTARRE
ncbi:hypothetical protein QO010_004569 [Caulobacter ginsengisoli]|uniref:DUF2147 domain-containing protein n=1 Tax=Caulobacter ginsengisoli TaxID=400775 RepID=A0ABU0IXN5_9CAUL|nr:hypothetical protein [Caulobacter ginsengisoli]MDQ0466773.1 hypothetical protein [Caulobacter ginsengisoli]